MNALNMINKHRYGESFLDIRNFNESSSKVNVFEKTYDKGGIPLSCDKETQYMLTGDQHSIAFASTGSGKTTSFSIVATNNMIRAGENLIVSDSKGDLAKHSAAELKAQGYTTYIINLRNLFRSHGYNILLLPYTLYKSDIPEEQERGLEMVGDIGHFFANIGKSERDAYWDNSAGELFMALILCLFDASEDETEINMRSIIAMITNGLEKFGGSTYLKELYNLSDNLLAKKFLSNYFNNASDTANCIMSIFNNKLLNFTLSNSLLNMLSNNDVDITKLYMEKSAIFIILPDENEKYHSLTSLIITQIYNEMICRSTYYENNKLPTRVNFVLEEFGNIRLANINTMLSAGRSRNIRFTLILQNLSQLNEKNGIDNAKTIISNCNCIICMQSMDMELLRMVQTLAGDVYYKKAGKLHSKPLLPLERLTSMDKGEAVILVQGKVVHSKLPPFWEYDYNGNESMIKLPSLYVADTRVFDIKEYIRMKKENQLLGSISIKEKSATNSETISSKAGYKNTDNSCNENLSLESAFDTSELIARIDKRIEELEKEEALENGKLDSTKETNNFNEDYLEEENAL